jgi:hypothetical protein
MALRTYSHPMTGKTMAAMVKHRLAPVPGGSVNPSYVPLDPAESSRNQRIAANMRKIAHVTNTTIMRVVLPNDGGTHEQEEKAQAGRQAEWYRQASMPWGSQFMRTPTDTQRLNNPAQYSAVRQRQLTIPNTYGQFYAFMHALSAAFGNLNQ